MSNDLSVLEATIITALAAAQAPMTLIGLMIAAATSYSSASVTSRVLMGKGLVTRRRTKYGYIYQLTSAAHQATQAKGVL